MKKFATILFLAALCLSLGTSPASAAFVNKDKEPTAGTVTPASAPAAASESEEAGLLRSAERSLRSMSKAERRQKFREIRKTFREWRHRDPHDENTVSLVLLIILAILIPPLAVGLYERRLSSKFWISLLLTILLFVPGVVYSLLVVTGVI